MFLVNNVVFEQISTVAYDSGLVFFVARDNGIKLKLNSGNILVKRCAAA